MRERVSQKAEDDSEARKKYLAWVANQHRNIRFSGMAVVDERAEVEMARVFVMPRVIPQGREEPESAPAHELLAAQNGPSRLMILGGPGSGKTTLLEAFALAFAQQRISLGRRGLPKLLPVFYRIRDLEQRSPGNTRTIWDCIQYHCSPRHARGFAAGIFSP